MDNYERTGFLAALSAYITWGLLPVYWKLLGIVPPGELLAWRVAGCGVAAWAVVLLRRKAVSHRALSSRTIRLLIAAALLIAGNWGVFIWAVSSGRILEASLGYYINPLVNVVLGVIFFSEKLGRLRIFAIALAFIGVVLMTLDAGTFPWVSILLALQFGFYGLVVKGLPKDIDSIEVLAWETALLSPIAAAYLAWLAFTGGAGAPGVHISGFGPMVTTMLLAAGVVTLVPLWLFGAGAKRIPMSALGFLQYVAPTMMLLLGTLVYGEAFGAYRAAAFGLVAAALALYSFSLVGRGKAHS